MQVELFVPRTEFRTKLNAVTPTRNDWTLFCPSCEWIGQANTAYATTALTETHGACTHALHIWRGGLNVR